MSTFARTPCDDGVVLGAADTTPCGRIRGRWILATTILGSGMAFVDGTVVNVMLPALQANLGATVSGIQWVVEAYTLVLAALMLVGGALGDRFGRRRLFATGVVLFATASVGCGLAPDVTTLIVARAIQGLGGALLVPGSLALISANFARDQRGRAIGLWSGFSAIASGAGLVLGGALIDLLSWRWVFFLNVPVAALVMALVFRHVPESRDPNASGRIDLAGVLLSVVGLGGLTFALVEASRFGFGHPAVLAAGALGVAGLALFLHAERVQRLPMMPLGLFREPTFAAANVFTLLFYAALGALFFFLPMVLIQVHDFSSSAAGAALLPVVILMFLLSGWSGRLVDRFGPRPPLIVGPVIATLGVTQFALPGTEAQYWSSFFPAVLTFAAGLVISVAPLTTTVMTRMPDDRAGLASGINNAISRVAGLLAIAAFGPVLFFAFRYGVTRELAAAGVPPDVIARIPLDQLAAAAPPEGLDADMAATVRRAIEQAFVGGFRIVIGLCAALTLAAALTSAIFIGRTRTEAAAT